MWLRGARQWKLIESPSFLFHFGRVSLPFALGLGEYQPAAGGVEAKRGLELSHGRVDNPCYFHGTGHIDCHFVWLTIEIPEQPPPFFGKPPKNILRVTLTNMWGSLAEQVISAGRRPIL